jgi:hypothetical protein
MTRIKFAVTRQLMLGSLALLPFLAACDETGTDADRAIVSIQMTDALADAIQTADVWVSKVYLQGGPGNSADTADASTGGRVYLFNNPSSPFHVDLLTLSKGVVANLTDSVDVEAGSYKQLRIVVDSAKVTLKSGFKFEDGTTTKIVKIPSGSSSGIKVQLSGDLAPAAGDTTSVLIDFDVESSFTMQPSGQGPNTFRNPSMSPVIREKSRKQS